MNKLVICSSVCLVTRLAVADDAMPPPPAMPSPVAPAPAGLKAISDRPYTLDTGKVELHGALPISGAVGDTAALLGVGASYGVSDTIQVGGDYAFQLAPDTDAAGFFAAHAMIRLAHDAKMSAAIGGSVFYSQALSDEGVTLFAVGLNFRYRLTPQLSLYSESNACGGCVNIAGPVMGQGLIARFGGETLAGFTIPVGVGYQVDPKIYVYGSTVLGGVLLSPQTDSAFILNDVIPITAGAWYTASNQFEIGGSLTSDFKNASDNYFFEIRARMFL